MAMKLDRNERSVLSVMEPGVTYTRHNLPETGNLLIDNDGGRGSMIVRLSGRKLVDGEGRGRDKEIVINDKGIAALAAE